MNFRIGWKVHLMNRIAVSPAGCRDNLNRIAVSPAGCRDNLNRIAVSPAGCRDNLNRPAVNITGRTLRITRHCIVPSCNFRRSTGFLWRLCLDDEGYIEAL